MELIKLLISTTSAPKLGASPFDFLLSGIDDNGNFYELEGSSCIQAFECRPYTEEPFLRTANLQTVRGCTPTPLYGSIKAEPKWARLRKRWNTF